MIGYRIDVVATVSYCAGKQVTHGWRVDAEMSDTPDEVLQQVDVALTNLRAEIGPCVTAGPVGRIAEASAADLATTLASYDAARKASGS